MTLKDQVLRSRVAQRLYQTKFYADIGIAQISWFTGKLPELMAVLYLSQYFGYMPSKAGAASIGLAAIAALILLGFFLTHTGLYDTEQFVIAGKNPVQRELLAAARIIIKEDKRRRG